MLGLGAGLVEDMDFYEGKLDQATRDFSAGFLTGFVFIEDQNDPAQRIGVLANQLFLGGRQAAAHQGNDPLDSELEQLHAIEETFHDYQRPVCRFSNGSMEIEQFHGFFESFGKLILLLFRVARPTTCIRDQLTAGIVNRNRNSILVNAFGAEP